jgi:hypothetical protein
MIGTLADIPEVVETEALTRCSQAEKEEKKRNCDSSVIYVVRNRTVEVRLIQLRVLERPSREAARSSSASPAAEVGTLQA